jgi:ribosome-associated protein
MEKTDSKRKPTTTAFERLPEQIRLAAKAAQGKKASDPIVLDLRKADAFTDYFLICSGQNTRQVRAIVDAVEEALRKAGVKPAHVEGYDQAGWVLLDFFDFIVHVFTPELRGFYSLERLWGSAERIAVPEDEAPAAEARVRR